MNSHSNLFVEAFAFFFHYSTVNFKVMIDAHLSMNLAHAAQATYGGISDSIEHSTYPGVDKRH